MAAGGGTYTGLPMVFSRTRRLAWCRRRRASHW
jgi:hypothetical protein